MSFGQGHHSVCALALLLASLMVAIRVDAGCLSGGMKGLFCRSSSYENLANDLYETTNSSEFSDNIAAALELYEKTEIKNRHETYDDLLTAFVTLGGTQDEEEICAKYKLRNLRWLAEAMEADGNLAPKKISEPIRRLNQFIIDRIVKARSVCFSFLARQWPDPWSIATDWSNTYGLLANLDSVPHSLLLDSHPNLKSKALEDVKPWRLSCILFRGPKESDEVLRPYLDLLIASDIIDPASKRLDKFYKDSRDTVTLALIEHPDEELLVNAYRLRTCELFGSSFKKEKKHIIY